MYVKAFVKVNTMNTLGENVKESFLRSDFCGNLITLPDDKVTFQSTLWRIAHCSGDPASQPGKGWNDPMNSKERVLAVYRGMEPDRIPTDLQGLTVARENLGYSPIETMADPQKLSDVLISSWEMVRPDMITFGILSLPMAMAAGNECDINEEGMLYTKRFVLEDKSALAKLAIPDPHENLPLPSLLTVCRRLDSTLGSDAAVRGIASLPWTVAVQMRGMEKLIFDTMDDPAFVHGVMRFCTEYTKVVGTAVIEAMGKPSVGLYTSDPSAGCSVISPKIYTEFVKPYHEEIVTFFHEKNTRMTFHICGYIDPIMEMVQSVGIDGISIDEQSSLEKMLEVSKRKTVVIGNVSPALFAAGTEKDIEDAVIECLKTAEKYKNYILGSGCAVPPQTPLKNLQAFMSAALKYGRTGRPPYRNSG
ncbi:MAG: uroporphyrinogen decarboxylase family protein [Desulfobacterales bacterium]